MKSPTPGKNHFDKLPRKLVAHIFEESPNLESLSSIIYSCRRFLAIFEKYAVAITESVIQKSVPRPLCFLFDAVISLRAHEAYDTYEEAAHCLGADPDIPHPLMSTTISPIILRRFLKMNLQIHGLAHICLRQCIKNCEDQGLVPVRYEVLPLLVSEIPSHIEPNKEEEERVIMGFWLFQYYMDLVYAFDRNQLEWDADDLNALRHSRATKGFFEKFESQLVGTAIETVLNLTRDYDTSHISRYEFDHLDAMELNYLVPDVEQLGEENILSCPNLLLPREYLPLENELGFYHLTMWSSTSIAAEYAGQASLVIGELRHLWPEPYWKYGFLIWDASTMRSMGLMRRPVSLIAYYLELRKETTDYDYFMRWKNLLTDEYECWMLEQQWLEHNKTAK